MTAQTLPDFATRAADLAVQAVDSADVAAPPSQAIRDVQALSQIARATIAAFKINTDEKLQAGVEAKQLIDVYGPVVAVFDRCLAKIRPFLEKHQDKPVENNSGPVVENFAAIERDMSETRDRLAKYLALASRAIPPIDPESLNRGRADVAVGRAESSRSILQRLQAGEDF